MKASSELGRPGPGLTVVEFVAGPHDGEREVIKVDPETLQAPEALDRGGKAGTTTYRRRKSPQRCQVDGYAAWHYDADRPSEEPAP